MAAETHLFMCLKDNFGVLLHDPETGATAAIDAPEAAPVEAALKAKGWKLTDILVTHHHADHTDGIVALKNRHKCRVVAPKAEAQKIPAVDETVKEGDKVSVGKLTANVIETPGFGGKLLRHVGVPLVLSFAAKGLSVNVNDRNEEALKVLQSGRLPFIEIGANELLTKALAEKKLTFTSRPNEISTKGPVIVTIGTPVDEFLNPVRRVIQDCLDEIVPHLKDGQLIVLRSTIYPGTTEWIDDYFKRAGRRA